MSQPSNPTPTFTGKLIMPERTGNVISFVRNIFALNPSFLRFCLEKLISAEPNSFRAKYLVKKYFENSGDMNMPVQPSVKECTHIKVTGVRCGSPALRGEQFCYFHQRMIRGVKTPPGSRLHPIALIENEEAIQASLMEVINALARNTIDLRRADLILKALYIAVKNSRRARFESASNQVTHIPDYPAPPKLVPPPAPTVAAVQNTVTGYAEVKEVADFDSRAESEATAGAPFLPRPLRQERDSPKAESASVDPTHRKPPSSAKKASEERKKPQFGSRV